jgi:hypothetical protein
VDDVVVILENQEMSELQIFLGSFWFSKCFNTLINGVKGATYQPCSGTLKIYVVKML